MVVTWLKRLGGVLLVSLIGFAGVTGPGGNSKAMETALTRELWETSDSILLAADGPHAGVARVTEPAGNLAP